MAIETGFGGIAVTQSFTDKYVFSDGISLPTGRAMANGSRACLIRNVRAYAAGRGGTRAMSISFGPKTTPSFNVGSAGSAQNTGWKDLPDWLVEGGTARFVLNFTGSTFFGRANDGSGIDSYNTNFGTLGGGFLWAQAPSQPGFNVLEGRGDGGVHFNLAGASDDGGASVNGYVVQWAKNDDFTQSLGSSSRENNETDFVNYGFTIGTRYYFRVAAKNVVTDTVGTVGPWSRTKSLIIPGVPSAPRTLEVEPVYNNKLDQVQLDWTAPSDTGGGITGYDIFNGTTRVKVVNGTATDTVISNLARNTRYSWNVKARNDFADDSGRRSDASNTVTIWNYSNPNPPRNLTATANASVAGRIDLTWDAPSNVASGITKYSVYSATGKKIADVGSSVRSYSVTGLTPGVYYDFYIYAWSVEAEQANDPSDKSNTAGDMAVGLPAAPSSLKVTPSSVVAGRLTLTWTQTTGYTGFNVYEVTSGAVALVGSVVSPKIVLDNLSPSAHTYLVTARNAVTDSTTPTTEGPRSTSVTGTPGLSASIGIPSFSVPNVTNSAYNGTYAINTISATGLTYALNAPDQETTKVPVGVSLITDTTNQALSGAHTITAAPTATSFTFNQTGQNIPANTAVTNVTASNATNASFNGTFSVSAVDTTNSTISYSSTGANFTQAAATGSVVNKSNTIYNGTALTITGVPNSNQFTYSKSNANLSETSATGTATDTTNRDYYNATTRSAGSATVVTTPTYNTLTYRIYSTLNQSSSVVTADSAKVYRAATKSHLSIKYRSGWAG